MMLVISVIVALAILSVLLGFIGGVNIFGQNAPDAATTLIQKVTTNPGITEIIEADFAAATTLEPQTITAKTTLGASNLRIICSGGASDSGFCDQNGGTNAQIAITGGAAQNKAGQKIKIALAACKRADKRVAVLCISSKEAEIDLINNCRASCDNPPGT